MVLAAVETVQRDGSGISTTAMAMGLWLGLAGIFLLTASVTPFFAGAGRLNNRRGQFALIGTNMVVAAAVGYLVVVATS